MQVNPIPFEKPTEIEDFEKAIREAIEAEIGELAAVLATTYDALLFGADEFKLGALAHTIAAMAFEQHLARNTSAAIQGPFSDRLRLAAIPSSWWHARLWCSPTGEAAPEERKFDLGSQLEWIRSPIVLRC